MPTSRAFAIARRRSSSLSPVSSAFAKRALDVVLSATFLALFAPLLAFIWLAVRFTSRGPAVFVQQRVGRDGALFRAYKFRTMVPDAEVRLTAHLAQDPAARREYETFRKLRDDPRVTGIGSFLRRYSLDELPQLLNVLKGEMSLVGPRCYMPCELPDMGAKQAAILSVTPGITGLWQVSGRNATSFAQRLDFDVRYAAEASLMLDLWILGRTVWVVLGARDAY